MATQQWLSSTRLQPALHRLASALEIDHREHWLSDFLNSSRPAEAVSYLQSAISSSSEGHWERAEKDARAAEKLFHGSENLAGIARSQFEIVYSLHRQSKAEACLQESYRLASLVRVKQYPWIETQNLIEASICQEMKNNFQQAERTIGQALASAQNFSYPRLRLRALGMQASFDRDQGRWTQAWTRDEAGLQAFWNDEIYSPEQAHQFYSELKLLAEATGQKRLAFALQQETVVILEQSKHVDLRAYAHFDLGTAAEEIADHETAMKEFGSAYELFQHLPQDTTTRMFENAAEINLAETEINQGKIASAQERLNKIHLNRDRQNFTFALPYWKARADIEKAHGNPDREEEYLVQAMSIGNRGFGNLNLERDRWEWRKSVRPAYLRLLELETFGLHDSTQALADWESFRNAEIEGNFSGKLTHDLSAKQRLLEKTKNLSNATLVSFVPFANSFVAWVADDRGIQEIQLGLSPSSVKQEVQVFLKLCSDRESPLAALKNQGAILYSHLFAPLAQKLNPERTLLIEGDDFLSRIPWAAMVMPNGLYFGEKYKTISIPGLLYRNKHKLERYNAPVRGLVVAPGALSFHDETFLPLPQVDDEVQIISKLYPDSKCIRDHQATVPRIRRELPQASFFHFSGHALTRETGGELLLWGANSGDALSAISLSKIDLHRCELVVLSACSSADVEQEIDRNPNGLVRSFIAAGARTVVASRWEIDFQATTELMRNFYGSMRKGKTVATSLQDAQNQLLHQPTRAHPYFWAAFEVFGSVNQ